MLALKAKPNEASKHGNAIMYGGESKHYGFPLMLNSEGTHELFYHELFYVETDFGNHMKLSWSELTSMFEVVGVRDYEQWRADRNYLLSQPSYLDQNKDHIDGINQAMLNLRTEM